MRKHLRLWFHTPYEKSFRRQSISTDLMNPSCEKYSVLCVHTTQYVQPQKTVDIVAYFSARYWKYPSVFSGLKLSQVYRVLHQNEPIPFSLQALQSKWIVWAVDKVRLAIYWWAIYALPKFLFLFHFSISCNHWEFFL